MSSFVRFLLCYSLIPSLDCSYAVGMYNLFLAFYYFLTIVRGWKKREFAKCLEKCCHGFIIGVTLVFASTGVGIGLFNPTPAFCYIAPQGPPGCASAGTCTKFGDTFPILCKFRLLSDSPVC